MTPFQQTQEQLRFEYRYDFMPKGLMTRFICRIHRLIKDESFWKSGVVLQFEGSQAYINHRFLKRKISVQLIGTHNKELLAIIRSHFDHIHGTLNNLKVNEMIPCNCEECKNSANPHFYEYDQLKRRIAKNRKAIECDKSFIDVNIRALLMGIQYDSNRQKIKGFIAQGLINEAIEEIQKSRIKEDEIILLESRWNRLVIEQTKGLLSKSDYVKGAVIVFVMIY